MPVEAPTQHVVMSGFVKGNHPLGEGEVHKEAVGPHLGDGGFPQGAASGMLESDYMTPAALKALYSPGLQLNHCFQGTAA